MYVTMPIKTNQFDTIPGYEAANDHCPQFKPAQVLSLKPQESLFFEGDEAYSVYEVISGVMRCSKMLLDGRRQVINFGYPGDMLGLSHDGFYHCDCDAVSEVRVKVLRKNAFMQDVTGDPDYCASLLRNAASEVNNMQEHFSMLGCKTAMEKLASFLVSVMDRLSRTDNGLPVVELPMMRSDIADFLGMTIETVSRNLTKLRRMGVIQMNTKHELIVLDRSKLERMAENSK